jgi:hypothetical protein
VTISNSGELDSDEIHDRIETHETGQPEPVRHHGKDRSQSHRAQQVQERGNQEVIHEDEPSGEESGDLVQSALRIRVNGAREREGGGHRGVAQRREEHPYETHQIGQRNHAGSFLPDEAEHAERGYRHHENHAVDEQFAQPQRTIQLLLVAELIQG